MKRIAVYGFLFVVMALFSLSCQKELSQESNLNNATFSLHDDSTKACFPIEVSGNYYNGVPAAGDLNFITVIVNIQKTGNYNIASSTQNGFSFADSGFFSKTGLDTLILKARGTPILVQTNDFTFNVDSLGTCGFSIEVQDSTGTGLGGGTVAIDTSFIDTNPLNDNEWHFTDSISGTSYSGTFITKATVDNSDNPIVLNIAGVGSDPNQVFGVSFALPNGVVKTGIYPIEEDNVVGLYNLPDYTIVYQSDEDVVDDANDANKSYSYIKITSYDASAKHIIGSFHCWTEDDNGNNLTLIKGSFNTFIE